ncbi:MAG: type IV toxin-antitoxin system AbiEi family antitoxin domain-containing protein [Acidiferrobacterales bacterium]
MAQTKTEKVLEIARQAGVLRPRDLDTYELPRELLRRLHARGLLKRIDRGLYVPADVDITEHHSLAQAQKRVPQGIICLLSALRFHDLTTQAPFQVWIAIGEKDRRPKVVSPPLKNVRFSGEALTAGIERHKIEGVPVRVYNPAKTVADCFKYRNKIGLDVALEALRECWRARRCTMDDLWRYAKICRVQNVMRPYLESLSQ